MAEERLTLLMRAANAIRTRKEIHDVGDEIDRVGLLAGRTDDRVNFLSRGFTVLGTRMGMIIIAGTALGVVFGPPLLGALLLLTAGAVALGGALAPVALLAMAATSRFEEMKDVAGSTAGQLAFVMTSFQEVWKEATAPGADILMGGLAEALQTLMPLVEELGPGLTLIAHAVASAMNEAATGLAGLGPEINMMFTAAAPLIAQMGEFIPALTSALIHLAIAGMPVLAQILEWLTDFSYWLGPALDDAVRFAHSAAFLAVVADVWEVFAAVAEYVGTLIANLATIAYELYVQLEPLLEIIGAGLLWAFGALGDAVDFVSGHMEIFGPIIGTVVTFFAALFIINAVIGLFAGLAGAALGLFTVLMAHPFVALIAVIAAVGVGIYMLWQNSETFRTAVGDLWEILKMTPLGLLIGLLIRFGEWLYKAIGGVEGVGNAITGVWGAALEAIRDPINWVIDKINWIIDKAGIVADVVDAVIPGGGDDGPGRGGRNIRGGFGDRMEALGQGVRGGAGGRLAGGGVRRPPRRGREEVEVPGFGGDIVIPLTNMLDGKVLTETVHRVARKRKSTR